MKKIIVVVIAALMLALSVLPTFAYDLSLETYEQNPSLNMLPYNPKSYLTSLTFIEGDGSFSDTYIHGLVYGCFRVGGIISSPFNDKGHESVEIFSGEIILPDTVTLSGITDGSLSTYYMQMVVDGEWLEPCYSSRTYTGLGGKTLQRVILFIKSGTTLPQGGIIVKPMLNVGEFASPFQPNLSMLYKDIVEQEKANSYDEGFAKGEDVGYDDGYCDGIDVGTENGEELGFEAGYQEGYSSGSEDGYNDGKSDGYNIGYEEGYVEGADVGTDAGYEEGLRVGKASGYQSGFKAGEQSDLTKNIRSVISDIVFAPYRAISTMFDFEIFGINIAGAIFTIFTLFVILFVIGAIFKFIF